MIELHLPTASSILNHMLLCQTYAIVYNNGVAMCGDASLSITAMADLRTRKCIVCIDFTNQYSVWVVERMISSFMN